MPATLPYFAYGSNLHPLRLEARLGKVELLTTAWLPGARLRFNKVGLDGSGKGNLEFSSNHDATAFGAVYRLTKRQQIQLNLEESLGSGYHLDECQAKTAAGPLPVILYRAMGDFIDDALVPYDWYLELVRLGAAYHRLPPAYLEALHQQASQPDCDKHRVTKHAELLSKIAATLSNSNRKG